MKLTTGALLLTVAFAFANRSSAATLPDACGEDKTTFEVKTQKDQPPPLAPAARSAQIIFVERFENQGFCIGREVTARVGVDGKWVGANHGSSYFAYTVPPGEHHLCVNWQSAQRLLKQKVGLASLKAEPGKVYYYAIDVGIGQHEAAMEYHFDLAVLNEDEGKYLVTISTLAAATPKK
jgi:hypothetical protein